MFFADLALPSIQHFVDDAAFYVGQAEVAAGEFEG